MGDIGDQAAALALGVLQGVGHGVEGVSEFGDFVASLDGYPLGEVALAEGAGGGGEAAHRAQGAAGQGQHQQHAHCASRQAGQGQRVVDGLGELGQGRLAVRGLPEGDGGGIVRTGAGGGCREDAAVRIPPPAVYADRAYDVVAGGNQREIVSGAAKVFPMPAFRAPRMAVGNGAAAVRHYPLLLVHYQDFAPREQAGAFHDFLYAIPAAVMVVVAGEFPVDALGAGAVLSGLDAGDFPLGGVAGEYADRAGGQGEDGDEAQGQAQL